MIELKSITKKFENKTAVDGISLKINNGEIVGFLGPNGAGKTTTMRIITGFFMPDEGEVLIENENITDKPVKFKSKIGYMPENNPLNKDMIVRDAINFVLELHNVSKGDRQKRIDEVVKATGIKDVYFRTISELSKGYKQRVGLALVLIQDPEILILDEPTEGLDPNQRAEIRNLIKKLGEDRTVIVSTHVMQEVEAMCNRIIILNEGRVIADGTKEEILRSKGKNNVIKLKVRSLKGKVNKSDFSEIKTKEINLRNFNKEFYEVEILSNDQDIFEKISKKIKEKDWVIYEIGQNSQNLEEVFRQLTKGS